jgi:WD40 repeat protein
VQSLAVPQAEQLLASTGKQQQASLYNTSLAVVDESQPDQTEAGTSLTALSPDGATWALASEDGKIEVRELASGQVLGEFQAQNLTSLALSPGSRFLAAGVCGEAVGPDETCAQNLVSLWEIPDRRQIDLPPSEHTGPVLSLAFSGEQFLASGSADRTITVWISPPRPDPALRPATRRWRDQPGLRPGRQPAGFGSSDASVILWSGARRGRTCSPLGSRWSVRRMPSLPWLSPRQAITHLGSDNGG